MKKYSLNFQAVFNSIEELQEIFRDVLEQLENENLDEHPNCLTSTYDVEVLKWSNKDVFDFKDRLKLYGLLCRTDAIVKYKEDYQNILTNIREFISESDVNYDEVIRLLNELVKIKNLN